MTYNEIKSKLIINKTTNHIKNKVKNNIYIKDYVKLYNWEHITFSITHLIKHIIFHKLPIDIVLENKFILINKTICINFDTYNFFTIIYKEKYYIQYNFINKTISCCTKKYRSDFIFPENQFDLATLEFLKEIKK